MRSGTRSLLWCLFVALVWVPLLGRFMPFTMMVEDYHPWYIGYASALFMLSMLFYMPASLVACFLPDGEGRWVHLLCCCGQSALLTLLLFRIRRNLRAAVGRVERAGEGG